MIDQIKIGNKSSFTDFEASVCQRKIGKPKKKSIRETVPFSNIVYDFSAINGEVYWEERDLEYVFEITADTPKQLEVKKQAFATWIMNIGEEELKDPFIDGYHFKATYSDITEEDDESVEKTTITVIFKAYPYMIADYPEEYVATLGAGGKTSITIVNNSSHRLLPTLTIDSPCSITFNGITYTVPAGEYVGDGLWLVVGENLFEISNPSTSAKCNVKIHFYEEIF